MAIPWNEHECRMIVADYFEMLKAELSGAKVNKTSHRRNLAKELNSRSGGSIEYKHQNISAILIEMGHTYIAGYKPASNYQALLVSTINDYLDQFERDLDLTTIEFGSNSVKQNISEDWHSILSDAPSKPEPKNFQKMGEPIPKRYNFSEREQVNRKLGEQGEHFVLDFERARLKSAGKKSLADDVEWTSKVKGDGAGYDIRSFSPKDESPVHIEVKTTNSGKYQPFYISANELRFSRTHASSWFLYRVFNYRSNPKLFMLPGEIDQYVRLEPKMFMAEF